MLSFSLPMLGAGLFALPGVLATKGPSPGQIKKLATFGDSYTDTVTISNGGTQWPVYARSALSTPSNSFRNSRLTMFILMTCIATILMCNDLKRLCQRHALPIRPLRRTLLSTAHSPSISCGRTRRITSIFRRNREWDDTT